MSATTVAVVAIGLGVCACGGGKAKPTAANYPVQVSASFPRAQRLGQRSELRIAVTNSGEHAIPDVAVTVTNSKYGVAAQSLATLISAKQPAGQQPLAGRSRPVWVIDRAPGSCGYACRAGGAGGAETSYTDTWALGRLAPGHTARFDWSVTAVRAGSYAVAYQVEAGLDTSQHAVLAGGGPVRRTLHVRIDGAPPPQHFTSSGQIASGS